MDDLNKRVLHVMEVKAMSRSIFAQILDISLPVLTHISSGRNKPGLELIQKILLRFPEISPDWLLNGNGDIERKALKKPDLSPELEEIQHVADGLNKINQISNSILEYHSILLREITYLHELDAILLDYQSQIEFVKTKISAQVMSIESKLKD